MATHRDAFGAAAVSVLATAGCGRGCTHRAVDRRAGVQEGTASRYARTRAALVVIACDALVAQDTPACWMLSWMTAPRSLVLTRSV